MNYTVLKTSTQVKPIYKVQNKMIWYISSAHKLVNDESNGLPMEDRHIQCMMHAILQEQDGTSLLCYAISLSELPSAERNILQSNSSPGVVF